MYVRVYPWEEKLKRRATRVAHRNNTKLHFHFTNNILGLGNPINFHLAKNSGGALRRVCARACVSVVMSPRAAVDRKTLPICTFPATPRQVITILNDCANRTIYKHAEDSLVMVGGERGYGVKLLMKRLSHPLPDNCRNKENLRR